MRKDASACLTAIKVFSAEGSRLTFRKSRESGIHEQSSCISPTNTMKHNIVRDLRVYLDKFRS
ncbi:hypothetical protein BU104_11585 [Staphylococcus xylosus]|uniref:Uncharacterized protein n=1 Tax=Staphylococcus xylosus TaxID=1288 RepID=A0AAQ0LWV6_STAXY|nr:hypothetical protein BU122_08015 [Staphylococcus xylosus]RIM91441.1 hypothetical protein BU104_11585 [Staphylococcus xylosus]